jgi:protease IV
MTQEAATNASIDMKQVTQTVSDQLVADLLKERISERRWKLVKRSSYVLMLLFSLIYYLAFVVTSTGWKMMPAGNLLGVVHIDGPIESGGLASADRVIPMLKKAFESRNVKAVALSIDSPGGAPVEAERIYRALDALKLEHKKPVYAFINNMGASAAYMVAIHADRIYAANYSLVGSVGAILSGWDLHKAMERYDVSQRVFASGNLKSMMNPYIAMTTEANAKAQELVKQMGAQFQKDVAAARGTKLQSAIDIATGEVWNGQEAKRIGLVDEIGTIDDVSQQQWQLKVFDLGPGRPQIPFMSALFEDFGRGFAASISTSSVQVR